MIKSKWDLIPEYTPEMLSISSYDLAATVAETRVALRVDGREELTFTIPPCPDWIRPGMIVDCRADPKGPIIHRNCLVKSEPILCCAAIWMVWVEGFVGMIQADCIVKPESKGDMMLPKLAKINIDERPVYVEWINRIKEALRDESLRFAEDTLIGILEFVIANKHITPKQIQAVENIVNCERYEDHSDDAYSIY